MRNSRIISDFSYSFLSVGSSIAVLQLLVYPYLSRTMSIERYGEMISLIGIITAVYQTSGGSLGQTRLIRNQLYTNEQGDFQVLLLISILLSISLIFILSSFFGNIKSESRILNIVFLIVAIINTYSIVYFRIHLKYKQFFISNILVGFGYIVGIGVSLIFTSWQYIFIFSHVIPIVYLLTKSSMLIEPIHVTANFKYTKSTYLWLVFSSGLSNLIQYLDKIIILPVLGGYSASILFASTYFAKALSLIMLPVSNVLLSYLSSKRIILTRKKYFYLIISTFAVCLISSITILLFISPITRIFFPTLVEEAHPYFVFSTITIVVGIAYGVIGLPLLVIAPTYWQFIINGFQLLVYLILALFFTINYGLWGFLVAMFVSNVLRVGISIAMVFRYLGNQDQKDIAYA